MARAPWYPKAKRLNQGTTGGTMIGGTPRAVLHSTETRGWAGAPYYHIEFNEVAPGLVEARQYRPLNYASRALRNKAGGVQTNRQGTVCANVSVTGYAKDAANWSPAIYKALHEFAVWLEAEWGVPRRFYAKQAGGAGYGEYSPTRLSNSAWVAYKGWCAHQNVPENTHWDVGLFKFPDMMTGPLEEDDDMFCTKGDKGAKVEYWQRRILRIDASALPRYGADADYGGETAAAVAALVPGSDGLQIGPLEAEHLDALVAAQQVDLSDYAKKSDLPNLAPYAKTAQVAAGYVRKGSQQTLTLS